MLHIYLILKKNQVYNYNIQNLIQNKWNIENHKFYISFIQQNNLSYKHDINLNLDKSNNHHYINYNIQMINNIHQYIHHIMNMKYNYYIRINILNI